MLTWEQVLRRPDIVGGDLEAQEGDDVYRGPIKSMRIEGDCVVTELEWCATANRSAADGKWRQGGVTSNYFRVKDVVPREIGDGRIMFNLPMLGPVVIFPKGGSKLDPAKVEGLVLPATPS